MIKFSKAVSGNTDSETAQVFIYPLNDFPTEGGKAVFAVLISAQGEDVFARVRQIGLEMEERFTLSQGNASERLKQIAEFLEEGLQEVEDKNILLLVWQENVLHLLSFGNNLALLSRGEKIVDLADSASHQVISGFIKPEDRLILINSRFVQVGSQNEENILWEKEFIEKLINSSLDSLADEVENYLELNGRLEPIAVVRVENSIESESLDDEQEEEFPHIQTNSSTYIGGSSSIKRIGRNIIRQLALLAGIFRPIINSQRMRGLFILAVFIGVCLIGGLLYWNGRNSEENRRFEQSLGNARESYQSALSIKDSDPDQAKIKLDAAKKSLEEALNMRAQDREAIEFKKELEQNSKQILRVFEVADFPLFLSLDLIRDNFSVDKFSFSLGKILLLDTKQVSLVLLDLSSKTNQVLAGPQQLGKAQFAALNGDNAFVFSEDKGVVRVETLSKKATAIASFDSEWGKIEDIFAFSGNVYLLDILKNQIWKYIPAASGYSGKNSYLSEGIKADLAGGRRLKIDYSVWVQKTDEILKFTGGASDFFSVGGIDRPIESVSGIFVPEEEDRVYLLDSANSRLVVLKKNGAYDHQYTGEKFKTVSDFVIDEENKKAYLLDNNKLYTLDLK